MFAEIRPLVHRWPTVAVLGQVFGIAQLSLLVVWFLPHCAANANVCRRGSAVLSDVHRSALSVASGTSVFHPSLIRTLLNISLSLSFLFDAVRVRSLWLASCTVLAAIYTASVALKGVWFCLESRSKRASFIDRTVQYGDEEVHGVYNGAFFWWVNPLFRLGFKSTLSGEDLPHLDQRMSVDRLPHGFARRWAFASKPTKNAPAYCTVVTFKSAIFYSFVSKIVIIALNYTQPFLIYSCDQLRWKPPSRQEPGTRFNRRLCVGIHT